ncbi:MAG: hypothetical protein INF65_04275 [Roseomonas sp.]|nr:hypothetical protein [Roseomonas sp.]MCA3387827.1 hypothetical protein [Roseomonas sp.]MCA3393473.1 hypothetical protein [Roseomonas sp.]MCA3407074.1 hypothetical protein [Roseomonas sp.]
MRRAAFALLFAMAALGCAEQPLPPEAQPVTQAPVPDVQITQLYPNDLPGPPGPGGVAIAPAQPSERTQAVAARLPLRVGPWVRAVGPPDEGAIARNGLSQMYVRYTLPGHGSWATVAVNDHGMEVPDGFASAAVAAGFNASKASVRANAPGDVARMRLVWIPDAPSQRCVTGRVVLQGQGTLHVACSTGVAGQELRVRATAAFRPGDSGRLFELEGEVARLIAEVTRAAAGLQPSPGLRSDGRVFIPRFGPEAVM